MKRFLFLLLIFISSIALSDSGGIYDFLRLNPSSLPSKCKQGDIRVNTVDGNVYVCGSSNDWATSGSQPPGIGAYSVMSNNTSSTAQAGGNQSMILGTPNFTPANVGIQQTTSVNGLLSSVLQNTSSGASAGAEYQIDNNNGNGSTGYGAFGINSSGFTGTGSLNKASATYLYSEGGDLSIGTGSSNAIHFVVNDGATDAFQISSSGGLTCPAFTTSGIVANSSSGLLSSTTRPALTGIDLTGQASTPSNPAAGNYDLYTTSTGGVDLLNSSGTVSAIPVGTVTVPEGGTGLTSITAHNVLIGEGTSNVASIAGGAGTVLIGSGSGIDPQFTTGPVIGVPATSNGTLGLANGATSGATVTIQNNAATSAYNFNLPATAGASGQVLASGGGGS